jgi:hypothetical protein
MPSTSQERKEQTGFSIFTLEQPLADQKLPYKRNA